jgi:transposase
MMGTQPRIFQPALFSYHIDLEQRVPTDHLLRRLTVVLDLSFVVPAVRHLYGRSGNVSLDPRVILKMMLLLFLYNVASERELLEQIRVRLDFLWFLGFDLETEIPDHSVLSKARARWGEEVFKQLFIRMVQQCVEAGLVNGSLLHADSTIVKASASKDSVVVSSPELVSALRQAYQEQQAKLEVLPELKTRAVWEDKGKQDPPSGQMTGTEPAPSGAVATVVEVSPVAAVLGVPDPTIVPPIRVPATAPVQSAKPASQKLPVNSTHISTTDPEAQLARNKSGVTELNYKEHRMVDDAHGVITAVSSSHSNMPDGEQLPALYEQHLLTTGLQQAGVRIAGDHHYGTAANYIYCEQQQVQAHLGEVSANVEERGKLPLARFVYERQSDRLRCPQGHYLVYHQNRPQEHIKVYLIEDAALCASCSLREQCTQSKRGRSIRRHVQAEVVEAARAQSNSAQARHSRKRRQHVMEGSFADAVNNHGAKKARWRGLARQRIQSWLIATVQNLRVLLGNLAHGPKSAATAVDAALILRELGPINAFGLLVQDLKLV